MRTKLHRPGNYFHRHSRACGNQELFSENHSIPAFAGMTGISQAVT